MKKEITKTEYLTILGLMQIARQAYKTIGDCEKAYGEIVGMKKELGDFGHFSDAIFNDGGVDEVLDNEGIKIVEN